MREPPFGPLPNKGLPADVCQRGEVENRTILAFQYEPWSSLVALAAAAECRALGSKMSAEETRGPVVSTIDSCTRFAGVPEVAALAYDLWQLRITLRFEHLDGPVYCVFDGPQGFRVLDEGDLCEFWDPSVRKAGWLWRVEAGGWLDLERMRKTCISALSSKWDEFLVLGEDECVSVLAECEPRIERPER